MVVAETRRLPPPITESYDWQRKGNCRKLDTAIFFDLDGLRGAKRRRREEHAKAICRTCLVINECLNHAIQVQEPYGVWGGMGEDERQTLIKKTRRDRRRSN